MLLDSAAEAWEYKLRLCIARIGLDSVDACEQIVAEMLELFRQSPRFGGSARENIVLNRLAFRVGLSESRIREMLVSSRRKAALGASSAGGARTLVAGQPRDGQLHNGQTSETQTSEGASGEQSRDAKVECELLEIVLSDPMAVDVLRSQITVDDFKHENYRRLLGICFRLSEEGVSPSYEKVMSAAEDSDLKRLVVTLEDAARTKAQTLRLDGAVEERASRQALLANMIELIKQRAEATEASRGRLAVQASPTGTLDPAQREALRRATEIHGRRARAKTTT
jgi:DNA primase